MDRAAVAADDDAASTSDDAFAYVARAPFEPRRFAALLRANFDVARFGDGGDDVIAGAARDEGAFEGARAASGVVWIASRPNVRGIFRIDDGDDGVVVVACACAWHEDGRGACETPAEASERVFFGDRRQHVVFEGRDLDAMKIKARLDACLLTEAEDADETNRANESYCGSTWPTATEVMASAGVEAVERGVKHKAFYPSGGVDGVVASTAAMSVSTSRERGGDAFRDVRVPEAFAPPLAGQSEKTFQDGQVGYFFEDMPCLECGSPWWFGEDWDSRCANCGADDRTYGGDQRPIRSKRRIYDEFRAAWRRLAD